MNLYEPIRTLPVTTLNLGSGKDFRTDAFNIDIDDTWCPDAVLDLSGVDLADGPVTLNTERFGHVTLGPGCFDRIVANDVLEHVPNLMKLMTTCLGLLRVGGCFEISVPYDLSFGAWQDPTHVRAFNERSWLYYTDWFWYMGWDSARFTLDTLTFVPSSLGQDLQRQGHPRDAVLLTPRAVDSMSATLRKVELDANDRKVWQHWRERRRSAQTANRMPVAAPAVQAVAAPAATLEAFPGAWADHADRYCLWIVTLKGYDHQRAFADVAAGLSEAFAERGGSAPVVHYAHEWGGRTPIVLGANLLTPAMSLVLPADCVIYNLEQASRDSGWLNDGYLGLLRRHRVLDYSARNTAVLRELGVAHARTLPPGFAPALARITPAPVQDIDVLFYGSLNERRSALLDRLRAQGLAVTHLFNVYGAERDETIARAKLVLNVHFYEAAVFESVRVTFLLANGACVVSEGRTDDPDLLPLLGGLEVCAYDDLAARCLALLSDEGARETLAARGRTLIGARRQSDLLAALVAPARGAA